MTWIFDPASVTVLPALFTAEYKKLPKDLAPAKALLCTGIKNSWNKLNGLDNWSNRNETGFQNILQLNLLTTSLIRLKFPTQKEIHVILKTNFLLKYMHTSTSLETTAKQFYVKRYVWKGINNPFQLYLLKKARKLS